MVATQTLADKRKEDLNKQCQKLDDTLKRLTEVKAKWEVYKESKHTWKAR